MRHISHARGLCAALEEEQVVADAVAEAMPVVPAIPDAAESPESAMLEVQEQSFEGEEQADQVDTAVDVSEALAEYQEVLTDVAGQGGLSTESLQILNIGLKYCYSQVGLSNTSVSMEGYTSRKDLTNAAMESIAEKAGTLFKAIVEAIKRGIQWLVEFFKNIFSSTKRMQARAAKLKELSKTVGMTDSKQELDNAQSIVAKLSMAGRVDAVQATEVTKRFVSKAMFPMYSEVTKIVASLGKTITDQKEADNFGNTMNAVVGNMRSISKLSFNGNVLPGEFSFKIDAEGINSALDKAVAIDLRDSNRDPLKSKLTRVTSLIGEAITAAKNSIEFSAAGAGSSSEKLPVLNVSDIQHSLANVEDILAEVRRFETEGKKLEQECNRILTKSTIVHNIVKLNTIDLQQVLRGEILKVTSRFLSLGNYICTKTMSVGLNVSKATMDYCELSLKKVSSEKMSSSTAMVPA